jgi:hypothetical protein
MGAPTFRRFIVQSHDILYRLLSGHPLHGMKMALGVFGWLGDLQVWTISVLSL